jgi:threonine dehydrogenase-like Zn-dependent dehydrogenase
LNTDDAEKTNASILLSTRFHESEKTTVLFSIFIHLLPCSSLFSASSAFTLVFFAETRFPGRTMKALYCENSRLSLRDLPKPVRQSGEVLIRVSQAGICSTDLEIAKGYVPGFRGILGHEFFGHVEEADDPAWIGRRVTAEINAGCGTCDYCKAGMERHCPRRTVLGIINRNGVFAEYTVVPQSTVVEIPADLLDSSAILIEPLAAALEILDQVYIPNDQNVLLIGDGRLAQLIGAVILTHGHRLSVVGKHPWKSAFLEKQGAIVLRPEDIPDSGFAFVIEASGSPSGLALAVRCVKPRGTIILKSTYASDMPFNPAPLVVNEITVVGSRCGRFDNALAFLHKYRPDFSYMISEKVSLHDAIKGFEASKQPDRLKIVITMG